MIAVDIGNTFTRIVAFAEGGMRTRGTLHTRDLELDLLAGAFAEAAETSGARRVYVASVVPAANAMVDAAAERAGLSRKFIKPGTDFILPHALKTPQTTGVDRLLSALAAGKRLFADGVSDHRRGYVTVQCGTAATVDFVDGGGVFRGGYILPGPALWMAGLAAAAQLPDFSGEVPDWSNVAIGDNTRDAMANGMHAALPMAVASAATLIAPGGRDGGSLPVVVTGGWGEAVLPYLRARAVFDKDLMLHGVRMFAERDGAYGDGA